MRGEHGLDVGDRVRVKLVDVDVAKGYIDFARALRSPRIGHVDSIALAPVILAFDPLADAIHRRLLR